MKLYTFAPAPNAAKVRLYVAEKKEAGCDLALPGVAALEEVTVNLLKGEQKDSEYLSKNPFGAVPALELEDGTVLHESLVIIDYLEECFPEASMWGATPVERALTRQIERVADVGVLISVAREIHSTKSPLGLPANPAVAAYHRSRWETSLAYLEGLMGDGRPFLAGDRVSVGDCTLQAILQFSRLLEFEVLEKSPRLAAWSEAFRERPAAKATLLV